MVATRRAARRSDQTPRSAESSGSSMRRSVEGSTSVRTTRSKTKMNPDIIPESHSEKMRESKTKPDIEEHLEVQATQNRSEATHLPDSVAELQADGYVSEAESNCSSVSALQTPLFVRITRRRRFVVPCQLESPAKSRQSRRVLPSEDSKCQDDDLSEAESCSSTVSGVQTSSSARMTRSRQVKANMLPVCKVQAEEVSDAESWCSGVSTEPSVQFKRMTRSMRLRLQAETISQGERKREVVSGDEKLPQHVTKSETIVISDSEPTKSDTDEQQASCLSATQSNEQLSPCKPKCHSESVIGGDLKQRFSGSSKKRDRESTKTVPEKEMQKDEDCEIVDHAEEKVGKNKSTRETARKEIPNDIYEIVESTEEMCDQTSEKSRKATEKWSPVKSTATFSQQTTSNKGKCSTETQRPGTRRLTQSYFHQAEEIIEMDKLHETGSPQSIIPSQAIESSNDDVVSIDSDGSQEEPVAESSSYTTKKTRDEGSLLISDSSESDSSALEETNERKMTSSCVGSSKQNALALDTSDSELLFVIDKTPGLDSSKAYYLEEKDTGNDGEGTKSKTSSELEEDEEEFIDEDESSLDVPATGLSFSSSIDPGLNLKDLGGLYINLDVGRQKPGSHGIVPLKEKKKDELLQKSTITPDFEKRECVPPLRESTYQLKKQRRAEREKTTGDGWFGMKAPEITDELKNDLQALKMRAAIDPKRFYKKNDREGLPKYFQVGTVVDSPVDFYHARIPKKERKKTIVEELLADAEFRRHNKRKYQDIIAEKAALAAGKKNRKKKKFHK